MQLRCRVPSVARGFLFVAPTRDTAAPGTNAAYGARGGVERILAKWFGRPVASGRRPPVRMATVVML